MLEKAKFVWAKGKSQEMNYGIIVTCNFENVVSDLVINISTSYFYKMFVNDVMVIAGPARAYHGACRVDSVICEVRGAVNIRIETVGYNVNTYQYVMESPFVIAEVLCQGRVIAATGDKGFAVFLNVEKCQSVQRYSFQRAFAECYNMPRDYKAHPLEWECVEARQLQPRNVAYPQYPLAEYAEQLESGTITINPSNAQWTDRSLDNVNPLWLGIPHNQLENKLTDEVSMLDYTPQSQASLTLSNSYTVLAMDKVYAGFVKLNIHVIEAATVYIIFDEIIFDEEQSPKYIDKLNISFGKTGCCNVIKYNLDIGEYNLATFEPYVLRYAKIIVTKGKANVKNFGIIRYENPTMYNLQYNIADPDLQLILEAAQNTLAQNSVDILMDCPSRERAGWLGDTIFTSEAEHYFAGSNVVERNFLENIILAEPDKNLPKGMIPMCYPADHLDGIFIPNYAMWFVVELKDYYNRCGDMTLINAAKSKVYNVLKYFKSLENDLGLLEDLQSWIFLEWSMANDKEYTRGVNFPSNMMYYGALTSAALLYNDAALAAKAETLKDKIIQLSYNGQFFEDNYVRQDGQLVSKSHITETCQYYAFYFGVADRTTHYELYHVLKTEFGASRNDQKVYPNIARSNVIFGIYMRQQLFVTDCDYGRILKECKEYFLYMAKRTGTLWENTYATASCVHGFASNAAVWIIKAILGLVKISGTTIYLSRQGMLIDCTIDLPILDSKANFTIQKDKLTQTNPKFNIKYID